MECNTVTFTAADGKELSLPLKALVEQGAIVASKVNGEDVLSVMGAINQLWIPQLPAKFYIRDIVGIRFTREDDPPLLDSFEYDGHDFANRPNVSVKAPYVARVGEPLPFEGYASDFDCSIAAIQFSLDQGEHWTTYPVERADAERWVYWRFAYTPNAPGAYRLKVRAVNEKGICSPSPAVHAFEVFD
ncbi:molybdopterin-binding protein [Arabiibacter massiliensis]|uniref:hypothetical protein n=1 Tax=Arabiibacter massiliensis TaxID=1870985 RepID=UPI001E2874B2|nr:hypothetical protein [Arabiibacter massiliensis]